MHAKSTWRFILLIMLVSRIGLATETMREIAEIDANQLREGLLIFRIQEGRLPTKEEGLHALTNPPTIPRRPILTDVPMDPWGHEYWYDPTSENGILGSVGPDGIRDTPDDVVSSLSESPRRPRRGLGCS